MKSLKVVRKKIAQKAYAQEKYGEDFVSNNALFSAVKSFVTEVAFKDVTPEEMQIKIQKLTEKHNLDEIPTEDLINTLIMLGDRRLEKLEALGRIEAQLLE